MELSDRITLDLLNHYTFVLHEDLSDLTDDEINKARKFAEELSSKKIKYKQYTEEFMFFVNKQRFNAITNKDYDLVRKNLYDVIDSINGVMGVYDWDFKVYYDIDDIDCLYLSHIDERTNEEEFILKYNMNNKELSCFYRDKNDDLNQIEHLFNDDYSLNKMDDIKI